VASLDELSETFIVTPVVVPDKFAFEMINRCHFRPELWRP